MKFVKSAKAEIYSNG